MTIGENIKKARKRAGLTQKELGERMDISAAAVSAFEKDKTNIKYSTIERFAEALGISVFDLSDNVDTMFYNRLSETRLWFEVAERLFKLIFLDDAEKVECIRTMDYEDSDSDEPYVVEVIQVNVDGELRYSIQVDEFTNAMEDFVEFFKYKVDKFSLKD